MHTVKELMREKGSQVWTIGSLAQAQSIIDKTGNQSWTWAETVQTIAVMYAGRIVETGTVDQVLLAPQHPYTQGLLNSIPGVKKRGQALSVIRGVVPNPFRMPPGCKFQPRCPYAWDICAGKEPDLLPTRSGATSRCYLHSPEGASRLGAFEESVANTMEGVEG